MSHRCRRAATCGLLWLVSCVYVVGSAVAQDAGAVVQTAPEQAAPAVAPTAVAPPPRTPVAAQSAAPPAVRAPVAATPRAVYEPVLALQVEPDIVSAEALRRELEAELGVPVAESSAANAGIPTLSVVWVSSGNVEVSLTSRSVPRVSRELALTSSRPEERVEVVALIAANMVRNEAATLLPDLRPIGTSPAAPVEPKPPTPKRVQLSDPCNVHGDAIFGIDFAPGVGNSSTAAGRAAMRRLSLGFAGTLSSRLDGLELSLGVNIKTVSVCGVQLTYAANVSLGATKGLQLAVFNLTSDHLQGVQAGVLNVTGQQMLGLQAGVLNISGHGVFGAQLGVANFDGGSLRGTQYGVANVTVGDLQGLQAGVGNVTVGRVSGIQAGVVNYAGSAHALQAGVANISAGEVRGVQLGVVNYADKSNTSIGVLSVHRRGRTSIDLLGQADTGVLTAGITHGGKYVHNSYGIGTRVGRDGQRVVTSLGLGVRVVSTQLLRVDIDAISQQFLSNHMSKSGTATAGLRVPVTFMLFQGLGVVVAPSYQVMITNENDQRDPSVFGNKKLHSGSTRVLGYPSLTFGLRYEFDHGV